MSSSQPLEYLMMLEISVVNKYLLWCIKKLDKTVNYMQSHVLILIIPETLGLTKFYFHLYIPQNIGDSIYVLYKIQNAFNDS